MNTEDSEFARIEREIKLRQVPDAIHHIDPKYITGCKESRHMSNMSYARQCKWPTCQSEEYQQALAEQIKRELVGEHPAVLAGYEHHERRPYGAPGEVRIHAILASQYKMPDGTIAAAFEWMVDSYRDNKNTIKLIPLYTIKETT